MNCQEFDVVIVGGGIVGALLALLLSKNDNPVLNIAIIDPKLTATHVSEVEEVAVEHWYGQSRRVSAVNYSLMDRLSLLLGESLERIAAPLTGMQVFTPECSGNFNIDAQEYGRHTLASVIDNDALNKLILQQLPACQNVERLSGTTGEIKQSIRGYQLVVNDQVISCRYLVAADGAHSQVRRQLMVPKVSVGQDTFAMSAQAVLPRLKNITKAFQWFFNDGSVLGILPVKGASCSSPVYSLVWSQPAPKLEMQISRSQLQENLLLMSLQSSIPEMFEGVEVVSEPQAWPLKRSYVETKYLAQDFPGLFFIGDAAHVIHPLAGQGLNLGLGDALALAQVFQDMEQGKKTLKVLSTRYAVSRFKKIQQQLYMCEGLRSFFMKSAWPIYAIGAFSFRQFDQHNVLKKIVVDHMSFS